MQWQVERIHIEGKHSAEYMKAIAAMTNEVERLLGVP
jgi:hypothetical protein